MHGLKFDRRRLRTRRRGVGHIDARHPGAVEHQPVCTLGAGRAPEGVALNSAHRRGVGFDLHQAHPRATRHALHHAPRYQARTWNALAGHAVKRLQRIAQQCGRGATNCDDFGALWRRSVAASARSVRTRQRLQLPMGSMREARAIMIGVAQWADVQSHMRRLASDALVGPLRRRARRGGPYTRPIRVAHPRTRGRILV
jgi:hypothetical protein